MPEEDTGLGDDINIDELLGEMDSDDGGADDGANDDEGNVDEFARRLAASLNDDASVEALMKEFSVEELAKAALREGDYTKKTQTVAAERKEVAAEKAALAEREKALEDQAAKLGQENQDLYKYLLGELDKNPDMTLTELVTGDKAVSQNDDYYEGDESKVAQELLARVAAQDAKIGKLESEGFESKLDTRINDLLDAVPDLVPSASDTKEGRQMIRADLVQTIKDRYILSEDAKSGKPVDGIAQEILKVDRAKQKARLGLLADRHRESSKKPRREGASTRQAREESPLDLDKLSLDEWQDGAIDAVLARVDAAAAD